MSHIWTTVKLITVIILFGFFISNSAMICKYFWDEKTVTSSEDVSQDKLVPPAIFICRKRAFTDGMKDMSTLEGFINNTLNLKFGVYNNDGALVINVGAHSAALRGENSTGFKVEHVYSYSHGLCYTLQWLKPVNPYINV